MTDQQDIDRPDDEAAGKPLDALVAAKTIDLAADTLTGDLAVAILDLFKNRQKPWQQMAEDEQRKVAAHISDFADHMVQRACNIIAAGGRLTAQAELETFQQKGREVTAKLALFANQDTVGALSSACGRTVQLLFVNSEAFAGKRDELQIDADQPALFDQTPSGEETADEDGVLA